ncbi:ADP-ribosylglycohydrolase family protein [Lentzea alba]|uniref:ADP-ribosylglycohydrolase family protein n=1 Tax=Lentzea alba TaxID=2714351 RepID=UPI0039BF9350
MTTPLTPMEHALGALQADFGHKNAHNDLLIPGQVSLEQHDFPEVLEVYTDESRLPAGVAQWMRVPLHTIISKLVSTSKFVGTKPQRLHVNPGRPFDTEFDLVELADATAQHMRICGCWERPFVQHEGCAWLDGQGRRFFVERPPDDGRLRGCLIAGAIGDALGANTENLPMEVVHERHGPDGITDLPDEAHITDDTQMTLFTFEAVIRAHVQERTTGTFDLTGVTQHAYQRWLHTQKTPWDKARGVASTLEEPDGWLVGHRDLFRMRAPGLTCTSALQEYARTGEQATITKPVNNSKGCGGAMRVAPVAFVSDDPGRVFALAAANAALTHGHPSGYLSAGVFAVLVHQLLRGKGLLEAVETAMSSLARREGHEEVAQAIEHAIELAALGDPSVARVEELGRGGVGDTALAIALYAALVTDDPNEALLISVNHGGDSDSTASMCGNLVGALHGIDKIRPDWVERVQFRDVIERMAADWAAETHPLPPVTQEWFVRYPPT